MRYPLGLVCVLALGLMGCETTGTRGDGGTGGMPECTSPEDCDDGDECTEDRCVDGACTNPVVDDGTLCSAGICREGTCVAAFACTEAGIREAIAAGGGPHYLACDGQTVVTTDAEITIDNDVILDGLGNVIVDGNEQHRVFSVIEGVTAELRGFTVTRGVDGLPTAVFGLGGGISNRGTLTLTDSTVSGNTVLADCLDDPMDCTPGHGGGIDNFGTLTLSGSTVSGNEARDSEVDSRGTGGIHNRGVLTLTDSNVSGNIGRGIANAGGNAATVTLINATVSENTSGGIINPTDGVATLTNSTLSKNGFLGGIYNVGTLTLTNSTVSGNTGREGGGVYNRGTATLTNSTVSGNTSLGLGGSIARGGGIYNIGTLTLTNSTVSGNTAEVGGGIDNSSGTLTLTNSTVSDNTADLGGGGGIDNSSGTLTLTNSTVSGNTAGFAGGGIYNEGFRATLTLTNATVSGNTAMDAGGGIANQAESATLTLANSTVSDNTAQNGGSIGGLLNFGSGTFALTNSLVDGDCGGISSIASNGYNIESPGVTCSFNQTGDQSGVTEAELNLGPLTDNGGPTLTHKPGDGGFDTGSSAAIDKIPEADCEVTEDQRGEPRPETGGTMCDVGSVEVQ